MTECETKQEWEYRYQERLGLTCEDRDPTPDERNRARREANSAILALSATASEPGDSE